MRHGGIERRRGKGRKLEISSRTRLPQNMPRTLASPAMWKEADLNRDLAVDLPLLPMILPPLAALDRYGPVET
jgi:hypothetical protein